MTNATSAPELVCPAGSLRALQAAVDAGADTVYLGLKDATHARNFAGLNFDEAQVRAGMAYAHARDASPWYRGVDTAVALGADALTVADTAVMALARAGSRTAAPHRVRASGAAAFVRRGAAARPLAAAALAG
jgi:putative protease